MNRQSIQSFHVMGIAVRTTNENNQSATDIPALWNRFMKEAIAQKIPGKISNTLYCIYTAYEKDHTQPYTTILGCPVADLTHIPAGMKGITIAAADYTKFTASGNLMEGVVFNEWVKIWNADLGRAFTADFEVYGEKTTDPANAEVDIFVAVK
jgi:predicted transcriptional regulator YdeE